ncbi:hypothetical protein D3C73_1550860 [compost metagenome]
MFNFTQPEFRVVKLSFNRVIPCTADHFRCHIYSDNMALLTYLPGGKKAIKSAAAPEVQNMFTRLQFSNSLGITASKA